MEKINEDSVKELNEEQKQKRFITNLKAFEKRYLNLEDPFFQRDDNTAILEILWDYSCVIFTVSGGLALLGAVVSPQTVVPIWALSIGFLGSILLGVTVAETVLDCFDIAFSKRRISKRFDIFKHLKQDALRYNCSSDKKYKQLMLNLCKSIREDKKHLKDLIVLKMVTAVICSPVTIPIWGIKKLCCGISKLFKRKSKVVCSEPALG